MAPPQRSSMPGLALVVLLALSSAIRGAYARDLLREPRVPRAQRMAAKLTQRWLTNKELEKWGAEFAARCGAVSRRFPIGKSVAGQTIWAIEISDKPGDDAEAEPNLQYIANMHGDEKSGRMLLPMLAEWLCENNGKDARATRLVRDAHLFLVPTMNPDGYAAGRRENRNGYDLNRNFPDRVRDSGHDMSQPLADTQAEARAVMEFLRSRPWLAGANFHEGALVLNIPYDRYDRGEAEVGDNLAPDDAVYRYLGKAYTKAHATMATDPRGWPDGITNGAGWYPITGGMQDWDYTSNGGMHVTIETNWQKSPPRSQIPLLWGANRDALLAYALAAMDGARGTVKNAAGEPLAATLKVKTNGTGSAAAIPFKAAAKTGFYARALAPGTTVVLQASADGYQTAEATVTVPAAGSGGVVQDFVLVRQ